jgi:AcrR family transcriptional regulator
MGKGDLTRQHILEHAAGLAAQLGLEGITIGRLADDLELSKSGLFAHFQSKEALQLQVMEFAAARFVDTVVRPALAAPRGEPRVRAMFANWLAWAQQRGLPGGCFFVAASVELDDRPGPVRARLVEMQRDWLDALAQAVRIAIAEGHFQKDIDPDQFAYEMYGIMLVTHHCTRLLRDAASESRARQAFERLVSFSRGPSSRGGKT